MTLEVIRDKIKRSEYLISQHAFIESAQEKIEDEDIKLTILTGKVIEEYPEDKRGYSILLSGETRDKSPLHVVLGVARDDLVVITVYVPAPPKWISPTERGGSKK